MTTEEKQLLLKDLCARLPYGVKMKYKHGDDVLTLRHINTFYTDVDGFPCLMRMVEYPTIDFDLNEIKPYLRPMSSMTKKERNELESLWKEDLQDYVAFIREGHGWSRDGLFKSMETRQLDWLLSRHFDVRGLIPKDLALVALDGMYKTE